MAIMGQVAEPTTREEVVDRLREVETEHPGLVEALRTYRQRRRTYNEQRGAVEPSDQYQRQSLGREYRA